MSTEEIDLELTPISEQVEPRKPAPAPEARLELAEIEPLQGELWVPPAPKRRWPKWIVLAILAVSAAGAFLYLSGAPDHIARRMKPAEFYTFSDEKGVIHIVDDLEKVPKKFRARAKKTR